MSADPPAAAAPPASIDDIAARFQAQQYVTDRSLATITFLALSMQRPLFLEGEAGVGKTEVAKVLAQALGRRLIRLQCYEGLDINTAVYEWNYARQMIEIRLAEATGDADRERLGTEIFDSRFLIRRPLLQALDTDDAGPPVLLIDELDRADEPFEAYLLELLSDFQVTVPEIGTLSAQQRPIVVITSNRTREIHDAIKRRCLYHWVDYPDAERERAIVDAKCPQAGAALGEQVVAFVQQLRDTDLFKLPGIAETLDWVNALVALNEAALDPDLVDDTLGVLLKYQDDVVQVQGDETRRILTEIRQCATGT